MRSLLGIATLTLALGCSSDTPAADGAVGNDAAKDAPAGDTPGGADAKVAPYTPRIAEAELERITGTLADDAMDGRDEGTAGGAAARKFIIDELTKCGIKPAGDGNSFEQKITTGKGTNIIGKIEGSGSTAEKARHVVISAHYDHLGNCNGQICNGADDNAAGVAIVIRVACALVKNPPKRSVIVASWDAEEPPTFLTTAMGSAFWVANPTIPLAQLDASIVLDLAGGDLWPGYDRHFVLGAEMSPELAAAVNSAATPPKLVAHHASLHLVEETIAGHQVWSDYDAFRKKNIPILFLTNGQNKAYHTTGDVLGNLNLPKMTMEADYLLSVVEQLAGVAGDSKPSYNASARDDARDVDVLSAVLTAALAPDGLAKSVGTTSKGSLQKDLNRVKAAKTKLDGGGALGDTEVLSLRRATQRIICLAGSTYAETICNLF